MGVKRILPITLALLVQLLLAAVDSPAIAQSTARPGNLVTAHGSAIIRNVRSVELALDKLESTTSPPVVTALAGSPDGRFLAVAGDDHAVRVLDVDSGQTLQTVMGHEDWIQSLLLVPEAHADPIEQGQTSRAPLLYSAGHDGRVLRWRFELPLEAEEVAVVPYAIRSISVSSEQNLLAIGGFADELLLMDLSSMLYVQRLKCPSNDQRCVRFSPDGSRILAGSRQGEILVWDTATGQLLAQYHEHQSRVHSAAFSADGRWVTSAAEDRRVVRFDIAEQTVVWNHELAPAKMVSLCLVNEHLVAVAGADNLIRLYDVQSQAVVAEMTGHHGTVAILATCGGQLASGSFDTTVRVWDLFELDSQRSRHGIPTSVTPIQMDNRLQIR